MKQEINPSNMKSSSRSCIFIASNPNSPNQIVNLNSQPFIKPAFPPVVNVRELMTKQSSGRSSVRGPNAFIIYRKVFFETARDDGYQLPMTIVSSMASQSWEQEPEIVKESYRELAKEANKIRNEISPKLPRRKKREQWNIVSFQQKSKSSLKSSGTQKPQITPCPITPITPPMSPLESSPILPEISFDNTYPISSDNSFPSLDTPLKMGTEYIPTNSFDDIVSSSILQQLEDYKCATFGCNDYDSIDTDQRSFTDSPSNFSWRDLTNDSLIPAEDVEIFTKNESALNTTLNSHDDGLGISDYSNFATNANEYIFMNSDQSSCLLIPIMDIADDPGITFSSDGLSYDGSFKF
ncbi:7557_t:CDS:1 [Scutellospora calospora]|uniref:7557_t:CDS:1 n=1 Tax=Scutellospora calospora TaxID=85575 RepID=A0ACA9KNZ3_9GLOM|nr:7557_t:CDS:1 [Scutellospora calospora]